MVLTKNGRLVLPAFAPINLPLGAASGSGPAVDFVAHQVSITGSFLGSRADMLEMLAFARGHGISPRIELMPMAAGERGDAPGAAEPGPLPGGAGQRLTACRPRGPGGNCAGLSRAAIPRGPRSCGPAGGGALDVSDPAQRTSR